MGEDQIIKGIMDVDDSVLNHIYSSYYEKVEGFLMKNGCAQHNVKDIFQESVVTLITNVQALKFKGDATVLTYLLSIARYKWLGLNRKKGLGTLSNIDDIQESEISHDINEEDEEDMDRLIQSKLNEVSEECMILLKGNIFLNRSLGEMAEELGMTYDFVRQKKRRCLKKIKSLLLQETLISEKYG